ncbi:hypothetical protein [Streptomyces spectabilis]|uniref:Uncharacterized protein n=1 Tax=Streptomyces spectabilis TaxID=68270 RepID=A0A7W8B3P9_STRST|nr:hypothetical protein [Streptomyces spectabilis]MBB5109794.1 hypothetical protein [Streptomyces spectabilis]
MHDWPLEDILQESSPDRPSWDTVRQYVEDPDGPVQGIVVHSLSDVADTVEEQDAMREWAESNGCFIAEVCPVTPASTEAGQAVGGGAE